MTTEVPFLQIEPTTRCNFTCGFCAGRYMPQRDMDYSYFCELINAVEGLKHVELQGEGEPLMHPRFFDMLAYINSKHPQAKISFITNGSLLSKENVKNILSQRIYKIFISIESANPNEFRTIRGGKLERVIRGIEYLLKEKSGLGLQYPVIGLAVTVLQSTVNQINAIGELYNKLGLDGGIMFQPLQKMACYSQFYSSEMLAEIPDKVGMRQFRNLIVSDSNLLNTFARANKDKGFYQELFSSIKAGEKTCPWLENGLYIAADGVACSCCYIKETETCGYGMLRESTMQPIMQARERLLHQLRAGNIPKQCIDCGVTKSIVRASAS